MNNSNSIQFNKNVIRNCAQGAIQGPSEFAEGLVLGVKSLFGHTVGGAAGAVSKITGAMGKGLAALTFDKDYQKKRREALNKKPANLQEGLARSGQGLVMVCIASVQFHVALASIQCYRMFAWFRSVASYRALLMA